MAMNTQREALGASADRALAPAVGAAGRTAGTAVSVAGVECGPLPLGPVARGQPETP
jgi:hypothetical protein